MSCDWTNVRGQSSEGKGFWEEGKNLTVCVWLKNYMIQCGGVERLLPTTYEGVPISVADVSGAVTGVSKLLAAFAES